ncbi:MAG: phosphoribosylformylglycinamidine synthase I [Patescibacteria group bacterium]|nr:phosphoribosylformylglycinamidine synthase I [Patescibacteria group bacterium]
MKPKVLVLTGYGINCEEETAYCFEQKGGQAEIVHVNDLIDGHKKLDNYQIMAVPGGFSYGDDTGSGNAMANRIKNNLGDKFLKFAQQDKLMIGICNGFQILTNLGVVPALNQEYGKRQAVLMHNKTARYECRWVHLKNTSQKCIWTRGINIIHLPIAHGEGNFYTEPETLAEMKKGDQIAFKYVNADGSIADGIFPINPNGALEDIAGITDPTGRILGMMPHPERFNCFTNENGWELTKEMLLRSGGKLPVEGAGMKVFENAVGYFG